MDKNEIAKLVRDVIDEYKKGENTLCETENSFPVSVSNRHIHVSREDLDVLFGKGYELKSIKDLSQPGQFAADEKVTIVGPKGVIEKVRILGPERKETQIEISITDSYKLGVPVCIRDSGDINGTPGLTVCGPKGSVQLKQGVIVGKRHIHLSESDAKVFGVKDKQIVKVKVETDRGGIFHDVLIRVSDSYALDMHIDTDEGNAFGVGRNTRGYIIEK